MPLALTTARNSSGPLADRPSERNGRDSIDGESEAAKAGQGRIRRPVRSRALRWPRRVSVRRFPTPDGQGGASRGYHCCGLSRGSGCNPFDSREA